MMRTPATVFILAASCLFATPTLAYVDIELDGNRHIVGDSYQTDGEKLTVFRPSGAIDVPRSTVRSIQQLPGALPTEPSSNAAGASATSSGASAKSVVKDPGQRDRDLAYQLLDIRMQRLTAQQRGDDAAMKKLDAQIKTLQGERNGLTKKHDGGSDDEKSD